MIISLARTVCRRTERNLIPLLKGGDIEASAYQFVNRLSDYLFTLARYCAHVEGKPETIYKKAKKTSE
jgi:cob(I)alamin adenosyltransferase